MKITTEGIFDLIGKGRYHSCILTTFTLSFAFFEIHAMCRLKGAGIRNILVLADGDVLSEALEQPTGYEFRDNKSYVLYPMFSKGVFHPKVILCFGKNEGFLALGSGNLTYAGHGSNHELWSVFHIKDHAAANAILFGQVWQTVFSSLDEAKGIIREKINWVTQYTSWLKNLPTLSEASAINFSGNERIRVVGFGTSAEQLILREVDKARLKRITIVSPFYDRSGAFLKSMRANFPDTPIHCVVDDEHGIPPDNLPSSTADTLSFYRWGSFKEDENEKVFRLHAKLIHFQYSDGSEDFLLGSSNASTAAMGHKGNDPLNTEINLFISRNKLSLIKDLGLETDKIEKVALAQLKAGIAVPLSEGKHKTGKKVKILLAVKEEDNLELQLDQSPDDEVTISLINKANLAVAALKLKKLEARVSLDLKDQAHEAVICVVLNTKGEEISNRQLIQYMAHHRRSNPDPDAEAFELLCEEVAAGNPGTIGNLLALVHFDQGGSLKTIGAASHKDEDSTRRVFPENGQASHKLDTYEEFVTVANKLARQTEILHGTSTRIAEFLTAIKKRQIQEIHHREDFHDVKVDLDEEEGQEEYHQHAHLNDFKQQSHKYYQQDRKAILKFFTNYADHLYAKCKRILEEPLLPKVESPPLGLVDFSNFLISTQLAINYTGRFYEYEESRGEENHLEKERAPLLVKEYYLTTDGDGWYDSLKSLCLELVSRFIWLGRYGIKKYNQKGEEGQEKKARTFKRLAVENALICICNVPWAQVTQPT